MKKKIYALPVFALFSILGSILFSTTASAYIDPSAMTYIVQIIAGIFIACGAAIGFTFRRIKRKLKKDDKPQAQVQHAAVNFENDDEFDDSKLTEDEMKKLNGSK